MGESQGIRHLSAEREAAFPRLARPNYEVTSDETAVYNCIAYAADDTTRKWDPYHSRPRLLLAARRTSEAMN